MSSLSPKDRVSLCLFTYEDGRRCRTPRIAAHPHFCFYHAQKESQSLAAATLGGDLAYFFSGKYLSACDLSTALSRLIPAVIRGEVKPKLAHTVAYLFQTLLQSIHISQNEYINAFGSDGWRSSIRSSVNANCDHLYPQSAPPEPTPSQPTQPSPPQPPQAQPVSAQPSPVHSVPSNDLPGGACPAPAAPAPTPQSNPSASPRVAQPSPPQPSSPANPTPAQSVPPSKPTTAPPHSSQPAAPTPSAGCGAQPGAAPAPSPEPPSPQSQPPAPPRPRSQPGAPTRDPYAVHYGPEYRLIIDGKPW